MEKKIQSKYNRIAMACQGGGSLGAYHIGVIKAMQESGYSPSLVAGISIGAFVGAIIAGNKPENRIEALTKFWDTISWPESPFIPESTGDLRKFINTLASLQGFLFGQPAFFSPRKISPTEHLKGTPGAISYYDTSKLRETLLEFVDFEGINSGKLARLILGVTRVKDGTLNFFDSAKMPLGPEHVMASGAMPPGFPGIEIDGDLYWDGGCSSNTPIEGILNAEPKMHTLCFMIDLFAADGRIPENMDDITLTLKNIQFSSRTTHSLKQIMNRKNLKAYISFLLKHLPADIKNSPIAKEIQKKADDTTLFDIIHLSYKKPAYEVSSCDCEFSKLSIKSRAEHGYKDMKEALKNSEWLTDHDETTTSRIHKFIGESHTREDE
ncbi:MAG: patatin-like phospholipase family protein [Alphaproteobacteria bacterium]|jgi:NTE family protein|nr:patatin-like phospholipase family protein [Alphaproteobacteria bacterium]MBP7729249.1 patatin-like phospholipase family protein [Alphaproteobacteria bacterium]